MRSRGFTLLELSVVLTIIAVILGSGMVIMTSSLQASQFNATVARMDAIEKALLNFAITNTRIPCPTDLTLTTSSTSYGYEAGAGPGSAIAAGTGVCSGTNMLPKANFVSSTAISEGGLPTRALKLPDDYMYDGWGRKFRYAVAQGYTVAGTLPVIQNPTSCNNFGTITVNDASGAARTTAAIYVLLSHGANGHGAYTSSGTTINAASVNQNEQLNCHCDNTGASNGYPLTSYQPSGTATGLSAPTYVETVPSIDPSNSFDNYDDIVTFKEAWQMQAQNFPLVAASIPNPTAPSEFMIVNSGLSVYSISGSTFTLLEPPTLPMVSPADGNDWNYASYDPPPEMYGPYLAAWYPSTFSGQPSPNGLKIYRNIAGTFVLQTIIPDSSWPQSTWGYGPMVPNTYSHNERYAVNAGVGPEITLYQICNNTFTPIPINNVNYFVDNTWATFSLDDKWLALEYAGGLEAWSNTIAGPNVYNSATVVQNPDINGCGGWGTNPTSFSVDDKYLAVARGGCQNGSTGNYSNPMPDGYGFYIYKNSPTGTFDNSLVTISGGYPPEATDVAFSSDGKYLLVSTGYTSPYLFFYNVPAAGSSTFTLASGMVPSAPPTGLTNYSSMAFSGDATFFFISQNVNYCGSFLVYQKQANGTYAQLPWSDFTGQTSQGSPYYCEYFDFMGSWGAGQ